MHINSIKGRDQQLKARGPNPLEFVGVTLDASGTTGTLWENVGGEWRRYSEIDGSASYRTNVGVQYRGKGFTLANFYPQFDWVADDGYNNFGTWVGG